ncbi:MAG: hypothetical protein ACM4AI_17250 [Acidobacteriota bacterium]
MTVTKNGFTAVMNAVAEGSDPSDRPAAQDAGSGASIDKVRDILFGSQVREFERRFVRLDERLAKEMNDLKAEIKARLDALELYAKNETESLAEQIKGERAERVDSANDLSRELKEATKAHDRRASALDDQFSKGQRELRQQMLDQHQRLSDEIRRRADEILAALGREAQELRNDKTDRATLASLLTEMALRLTNELHLPDVEGVRNG